MIHLYHPLFSPDHQETSQNKPNSSISTFKNIISVYIERTGSTLVVKF